MRMNTDLLPREGRVLCAVSGGMDSMYLLCRLRELGYDLAAAHYNHGLRGAESDRDEAFVRDFCGRAAIPFLSERGDCLSYAREKGLSLEDGARTLRYAFLKRAAEALGAVVIATAHNGDDNAETMLLNLLRGTGLRGLGGIPPVRGKIVRPMLSISRREIETYIQKHHIPYVEDSTNGDDTYTRNRLRHEVMPVLRALNPAFVDTAGRAAERLRQDGEYLDYLAEKFVLERSRGNTLPAGELLSLPEPVMSRAVRRMGKERLSFRQTRAVLALEPGDVTDVSGMRVGRTRDRFIFGAVEKGPIPERSLVPDRWVDVPEAELSLRLTLGAETKVHRAFNIFSFSYEKIYGTITVASRREGDRFRPVGRGLSKSLKQVFQEQDIPPWERDGVPVLRDDRGIIFVYGVGPDERICCGPDEKNIGTIEFVRLGRTEEDKDDA